jgi:hypothetical protein
VRSRSLISLVAVLAPWVLLSCGSDSNTGPDPNPPNPPPGTSATITIQLTLAHDSMVSGGIYGRAGTSAVQRVDMTAADLKCGGVRGPRTCTFTANVGQTVTLIATEPTNIVNSRLYNTVPRDPRLDSGQPGQFDSFGAPCATPAVGVCTFQVAGNTTITARFKLPSLTNASFLGMVGWRVTTSSPPPLAIGSASLVTTPIVSVSPDQRGQQCLSGPPAPLCIWWVLPTGSTITFETLAPPPPQPTNSSPLLFVRWSGGCTAFSPTSACSIPTTDAVATAEFNWEYYKCTGEPGINAGTSGWKFPPGVFPSCSVQEP